MNSQVWWLQHAANGSIFANLVERPVSLWRLAPSGGAAEEIESLPLIAGWEGLTIAILGDGRAVIPVQASGRAQLMAWEERKPPVPLIAGTEETGPPVCVVGPQEIAFAIGPEPRQTIGVADVATGSIKRRIALNRGQLTGLASSPNGKMLFCAAGGVVWAVPAVGGEPHRIRDGEGVAIDPSGRYLVVEAVESLRGRLFQVPLAGGPEREIPFDNSVPIFPLPPSASSISADNRLLLPLSPRDSWFNPPGVLDLASGRMVRIPSSNRHDHAASVWMSDGRVLTIALGLRSSMWKFTPEPSAK